jgi:hypothetical protein
MTFSGLSMWKIGHVCDRKVLGRRNAVFRSLESMNRQAQYVDPGVRLSRWEFGDGDDSGEAVGYNRRSRIVS